MRVDVTRAHEKPPVKDIVITLSKQEAFDLAVVLQRADDWGVFTSMGLSRIHCPLAGLINNSMVLENWHV